MHAGARLAQSLPRRSASWHVTHKQSPQLVNVLPEVVVASFALLQAGDTALHLAAAGGHIPVVRELLRAGADAAKLNQVPDLPPLMLPLRKQLPPPLQLLPRHSWHGGPQQVTAVCAVVGYSLHLGCSAASNNYNACCTYPNACATSVHVMRAAPRPLLEGSCVQCPA
jgi:cbb3-type cytochrome oxidase cytochrome c subunit